jgi:hypothetical protein
MAEDCGKLTGRSVSDEPLAEVICSPHGRQFK